MKRLGFLISSAETETEKGKEANAKNALVFLPFFFENFLANASVMGFLSYNIFLVICSVVFKKAPVNHFPDTGYPSNSFHVI